MVAIFPSSHESPGASRPAPRWSRSGPAGRPSGYSTTSVERASGQHARDLLVIVEEASGVEDEIWDAIESLKYSKLIAIGNPIRAEGRFVDLIRQADRDRAEGIPPHKAVNAIQIPSTDSPHAEQEVSEYGLADKTWLEACYRRYGRDSLWVRSHINAIIPEISSAAMFPRDWLDYACTIQRPPLARTHPVHQTRRIAIDLGKGVGRDSTAIIVRDSLGILDLVAGNSLLLSDAAAEVARLARLHEVPAERISYDGLGIGRDFPNYLARHGLAGCVRYVGGGRPREPNRFCNLRTEAAWTAHDALNPERHSNDRVPAHVAASPVPHPTAAVVATPEGGPGGHELRLVGDKQVRLIKKEDLLIRLGRSPDQGTPFANPLHGDDEFRLCRLRCTPIMYPSQEPSSSSPIPSSRRSKSGAMSQPLAWLLTAALFALAPLLAIWSINSLADWSVPYSLRSYGRGHLGRGSGL